MNRRAAHQRTSFDLVVPTLGRPSLQALLESLDAARGPLPDRIMLVHDAAGDTGPLGVDPPQRLADRIDVLQGRGTGPAAARNIGWRAAGAEWVAFLDDDVVVPPQWLDGLVDDLEATSPESAGVQGRIRVPLPLDRRPTDWERNVSGLETARWATADLAYRRLALEAVGGFDERFPRAYREDADLGLRLTERGWRIDDGSRFVIHPVRPADRWVSVTAQAGNGDDALMRALHGRGWRERAGIVPGDRPRHLLTAGTAAAGAVAAVAGRRRLAGAAALAWAAATTRLAYGRIAPGPRTADEVTTMVATSAVLPLSATAHWIRGWVRVWRNGWQRRPLPPPAAVLFDRDGTLIEDVPYNGDPARVRVRNGAREALDRLRGAGIPTAVVSNQSGVGRGYITLDQVDAVNREIERQLGPVGPWAVCPHAPADGCPCRKPAPGLVRRAAGALGVEPARCAVIGDIGADVEAARSAGARAVLVPTAVTEHDEVRTAPAVAVTLPAAVDLLLEGRA